MMDLYTTNITLAKYATAPVSTLTPVTDVFLF